MSEDIACSRCGELKPPSEYYKGRRQCKTCVLAVNRRYRQHHRAEIAAQRALYTSTDEFKERTREWRRGWRENNREAIRSAHAEWRKANPDRLARYRANDPEGSRRRSREWYAAHRDLAAERSRQWREDNPQAYRLSRRKRRMQRRALEKSSATAIFSIQQLQARIDYYGGKCWMCRTTDYEQIDHVKPLSKGGPHMLSNLRPACRKCNRVKAARWPGPEQMKELVTDVLLRSGSIRLDRLR